MPTDKMFVIFLLCSLLVLWSSYSQSASYTYDARGRLTSVTYDDGKLIEYQYDSAGNRTTVNTDTSGYTPPNRPPVAQDDSVSVSVWQNAIIYPMRNDSDPDGDTIKLKTLSKTTKFCSNKLGEAHITCFYTIAGTYTLDYTIDDTSGETSTATITVYVSNGIPLDPVKPPVNLL